MSEKRLPLTWEQKYEERLSDPKKQAYYRATGQDARSIRIQIEKEYEKEEKQEQAIDYWMNLTDEDFTFFFLTSTQRVRDNLAFWCSLEKGTELKNRLTQMYACEMQM